MEVVELVVQVVDEIEVVAVAIVGVGVARGLACRTGVFRQLLFHSLLYPPTPPKSLPEATLNRVLSFR